ncbi:MAG: hypothetical protein ABSG04_01980 [Verrucomicrobiota bacterium]
MSKYYPTKIELANGWQKVKGCMLQTFAHYLWKRHFKPAEGDSTDYGLHEECHIVERGTLVSVLLNIRVLNDFFSPCKYPTDINASQYPNFKNPGAFLSEAEARALDKHIAHLTKERVSVASMGWYPPDLIERAYEKFELFAAYARDDFFKDQKKIDAIVCRDWERLKRLLKEQAQFYESAE